MKLNVKLLSQTLVWPVIMALACCKPALPPVKSNINAVTQQAVSRLMSSMAYDVTAEGPAAWLIYFEDSPDFYMASDGELLFPDHKTADSVTNHQLVPAISHIRLQWQQVHVEPLTDQLAAVRAGYQERITYVNGKAADNKGYFTAIAHADSVGGWRLRSAHWSVKK